MGSFRDNVALRRLQRQLTVVALFAFLVYLALQLAVFFADMLRILGISFLLSYLVINVVDIFDRFVRNRAISVALVYVCLLGITIVAAFLIIPAMVYQVASLVTSTMDRIPDLLHMADQALIPLQQKFHQNQIDIKVIDVLTNFVGQLPKPDPGAVVNRVMDMAMSTMTWSVYSVSISVVTFYFLLDGHLMKDAVIRLFPEQHRLWLNSFAHDVDGNLQSFFKGQLVLGVLFGLVMLIVYIALGVQYSLILSVFLALCEVLPVIGPPIGFAPALVAVAMFGTALPVPRFAQIILLTVIFVVLQQVKDNVVAPRYIGNVIGLHPVLIFMAIMIGGKIDGMLGIILSLPVACVINVLMTHLPKLHESALVATSGSGSFGASGEIDATQPEAIDESRAVPTGEEPNSAQNS
jgi:predicted PurR-regulated permease PerM